MCITKACANRTRPGVWWREDDQWCLYGAAHQQQIRNALSAGLRSIDLGTIRSGVHPYGARYTVDLVAMEQTALSSGYRRSILVIDPVATPPVIQPPETLTQRLPSTVSTQNRQSPIQLHGRDPAGNLFPYPSRVSQAILNGIRQGHANCLVPMDSDNAYYYFDLKGMVQLVVILSDGQYVFSNEKSVSFSVEIAWNPTEMATLAVSGEKAWRRKVLEMVASRFRNDSLLIEFLRKKAPETSSSMSFERASVAPGELAYEKFLDSMDEAFTKCDPKFLGTVLQNVQEGCLESDNGLLQIGFQSNLTSRWVIKIDPSVRRKEDQIEGVVFWKSVVSALATETLIRCQNQLRTRVAVFLILLPHPKIGKVQYHGRSYETRSCSGVEEQCNRFEIVKPEHYLPLAKITV